MLLWGIVKLHCKCSINAAAIYVVEHLPGVEGSYFPYVLVANMLIFYLVGGVPTFSYEYCKSCH